MARNAAIEGGGGSGLVLTGRILSHSQRDFPQQDGTSQRCHTYRILSGIDLYFVDDWGTEPAMPAGERVIDLPVFVKVYRSREGAPAFRLCRRSQEGEA